MAKTPIFETQACTRCGGSGNYSYCQMHGTVCFQCGGSKVQLTKRGHAAQVFYNNLLTKPASEFKVGDSYRMQGDPKAYRIEEIKDDPLSPGLIQLNGSGMSYGTQPSTPLRSVPTTEVRDAARAKALEYQASLNSRGKPKKVKRTDAAAPSVIDPAASGNTCAVGALDTSRTKAKLEAQRKAFKMTVLACEQAIAGGFVWLYAEKHDHKTLADIAHKGLAWGGITERQLELVNNIRFGVKAQWVVDKEARLAERAAADKARADAEAAAEPVPETDKRIHVKGEVLTVKDHYYEEMYMGRKMLVRTTQGFKLWGSVPSSIDGVARGAMVEFDCAVQRSKDDAKFGFFKRPTKARTVSAAPAAEQTVAA